MEEHIDLFQKIITKIQDKVDYADIISLKGNSNSILMKDNKFQNIDGDLHTQTIFPSSRKLQKTQLKYQTPFLEK